MATRKVCATLLLALLLGGCARGAPAGGAGPGRPAASGTPAAPGAPAGSGAPAASGTPASSASGATGTAPAPAGDDALPQPAPGALQRVTYDSALAITGPGRYFVDLASGKVEGWRFTGGAPAQVDTSEDRRWVIAQAGQTVYWAWRSTGAVYSWDTQRLRLLASGAGLLLFERLQGGGPTGSFVVLSEEFQPLRTFHLDFPPGSDLRALIAPDGKSAVVGGWPPVMQGGEPGKALYLVDLAGGAATRLSDPPAVTDGQLIEVTLTASPRELVAYYQIQQMEKTGLTRARTVVRRYSWQGRQLGEFTVDGQAARLSPDGHLLAVLQDLDHLAEAALVVDLASGQPLFRVAGIGPDQWLADSSGLLLTDWNLNHWLVSAAGDLKQAPPLPPAAAHPVLPTLKPAPDNPDRFAAGLSVIDGSGRVLYEVKLPQRNDWLLWDAGWGASSQELVFSISTPVGKDFMEGEQITLPPRVQKPPFPDRYLLQVQDPAGQCLNLRAESSTSARVIRCLPSGTKLAIADLSQAPVKLNAAFYAHENRIWVWVQTEQGEVGWVAASSGSLTWAG